MKWKSFFLLLFCFIVIDYVVISYNRPMWNDFVAKISSYNPISQGIPKDSDYTFFFLALTSWFLLVLGLYIFVLDKIHNLTDCVIWGTVYAFIVYGVYNFTNMTLMKNIYNWDMAWRDILSGIISTSLALMAYFSLSVNS
jgi:hypothetical protein